MISGSDSDDDVRSRDGATTPARFGDEHTDMNGTGPYKAGDGTNDIPVPTGTRRSPPGDAGRYWDTNTKAIETAINTYSSKCPGSFIHIDSIDKQSTPAVVVLRSTGCLRVLSLLSSLAAAGVGVGELAVRGAKVEMEIVSWPASGIMDIAREKWTWVRSSWLYKLVVLLLLLAVMLAIGCSASDNPISIPGVWPPAFRTAYCHG